MSMPSVRRIHGQLMTGLFWLLAVAGLAQTTNNAWLVRSWQSEDGLPDNTVQALAQSADGFLWVGTPSGLARFDGARFETFSLTNLIPRPNLGAYVLLRGKADDLWVAMDRGGVVHLNGRTSRAFTQGLPNFVPNGLAEDGEGGLWISYRGGSVYRLKDGAARSFTMREGLPEGPDNCALTTDNQGRLWFAKAGRVGQFRDGSFQTMHHLDSHPMKLAAARDGGVWLCNGFQLYKCDADGGLKDWGTFQPSRSGTIVSTLLEDREGAVWIGTSFSGLFRRDSEGFAAVPTTHEGILSVLEDGEGSLWGGTSGGGLDRIRRRAITLEGAESSLPFPAVQSICEDAQGSVWAATQNGELIHRSNGRWAVIPVSGDWPGGAACVAADGQGAVWIGSRHGLYCWRAGQFVPCGDAASLRGRSFNTVLASKTGDVWLGRAGRGAILRVRAGLVKTFEIPPGSRTVRAMTEDAAGNIWVGTSQGALFRITGDELQDVTPHTDHELAPIRCLYATADGTVWAGYAGWGVGCFKDGRYAEFSLEQGLYDKFISHIVADDRGWLWFGANRGLFRVRQQDFQEVAAGNAARVRAVHYGRGEGLPSLQGTFGKSPDVLRSHDGRLWLPMQTALVVVDPARLNNIPVPPPTLLSRVTVDERLVARYGGMFPVRDEAEADVADLAAVPAELRLPAAHRRIEIEFAALSFYAPENVQFRYRLKGFENEWIEAGTHRSVTYSRLPGGHYVFEMTAGNSDGDWNKTGASLSLVVAPFYWQTWWFRAGVLAMFTAGIIVVVRYVSFRRLQQKLRALEQLAALQKERARIAKDIHDDVGASLTQIAYVGELAQRNLAESVRVAECIGKMSATARQAVKSLDEIVWAVNPRNDTLAHLIDYAGQFTFSFLQLAGIRVRLDFPDQIPERELSTDLRHNIFLTIKEALHNVVKHAGATEVWLRATVTDIALEISVEDNGRGFVATPDDALADGLRNMRQRMADIGGEFSVASQPGGGTKVSLRLRWPQPKTG